MKIVFLGDSLTKGTSYGGVTTTDTFAYKIGIATGYLAAEIINAGVNGDTSANALARLNTDVIAYNPAVCSIMIGINDWATGVPVSTYQANMRSIIQGLLSANIRPVCMSSVMQRGSTSDFAGFKPYLEALQSLMYEMNLRYVDIYREYAYSYLYLTSTAFNANYADILHQTPTGHSFIASIAARQKNIFTP